MSSNTKLIGTGVALVTPFKKDFSIDFEAYRQLIEFVSAGSLEYLVVNGTTGESPTLSWKEKLSLLNFTIENNPKRLPIVFGHGGNNTLQLIDELDELKGFPIEALLSANPYYNKPSQDGIIQHYEMLADASKHPILLYNVPYRSSSNMDAKTSLELAQHKNILGIKEASGNLVQGLEILKDKPEDFLVLAGDDVTAFPLVCMGAQGVISVIANYEPFVFSEMIRETLKGNMASGRKLNLALTDLYEYMSLEGNPTSVKTALEAKGICKRIVRPPLVEGSEKLFNIFIERQKKGA